MKVVNESQDGPTPAELALIERQVAQYESAHPDAPSLIHLYPFYPQGGTLWQDIFVNNFVDMNTGSPGILDWDCTDYTYDGHHGHDSLIRSFSEKAIGVPVFAALPGTVIATHDGEPDENTTQQNVPANYVIIDHGGSHHTWYFHLKQFSVAVLPSQQVVAGQQLGLTASSGFSNWPHLHFESQHNGTWYEPSTGATCNPGPSGWVDQEPIRRDLYVRDFVMSPNAFTNTYPYDTAARTGTFVQGATRIDFRFELGNHPAGSTYRIRVKRPDASFATDFSGSYGNPFSRYINWWFFVGTSLNQVGQWRLILDNNGTTLIDAPFDVVASAGQIVNRPPAAVSLVFDPVSPTAGDVIFCRVQTSLLFEDPDYALVRYRYVWRVNGSIVRDNVFAALSDALPSSYALTGNVVACEVTPSDGAVNGPTASASVTVTGPTAVRVRSLAATASARGVVVRWRTASEVDLLGFNVYRESRGARVRVNQVLIPSVFGGTASGHAYSWVDRAARRGASLGYRLQAVSLSGARRWIGFVAVAR